jgi:glyoxylase-like metal-dependent hydrolase (beta-lactamase superfamily II)
MANRTIRHGDIEITALVDAVPAPVDPAWSYPAVPAAAWAATADGSLDAGGRFRPNLACFLVRAGGRKILVDAGMGPGPNAYLAGLRGNLPSRLAEAGAAFGQIDAVVFTHLHMDHVGWAATAGEDGAARPTMPGARHYVAAAELDYWAGDPADAGAHHRLAFDAAVRPLMRDGLLARVDGADEMEDGVWFLSTPGHTPGHSSVVVRCGDAAAVIAGDVFHCPAQIAYPDRCHRADRDAGAAERSRRGFIERAASDGWLVAAGHFRDDVVFGRIAADGKGGFRHVPA